jgi:phage-related minor tail protein
MAETTDTSDLEERLKLLESLNGAADRFGATMSSGLKQATLQGKSLDEVLKSMALRLSSNAIDAALKPLSALMSSLAGNLTSGLGSALSSILPFAKGGVVPFADGGVVASPTYFPLDGGLGVAGEAGAEAILPLTRGADGRLGVAGGQGGVAVTFNVTTPNVESFRQSEAQVTAMLARAVGRGRRGL